MQLIEAPLNSLENGIKVRRKLLDALHDDALIDPKEGRGDRTCGRSSNLPGPDPWQQIEAAATRERAMYLPYTFIEGGAGFNSILFRYARLLLRGADERAKPNTERLAGIHRLDAAADRAAALRPRAHLCGSRDADPVLLAAANARMARSGLPAGAQPARQGIARDARHPGGGGIEARRSRSPHAVVAGWQGRGRPIARSDDRAGALASTAIPVRCAGSSTTRSRRRSPPPRHASPAHASRPSAPEIYPDATFTLRLNYGTVTGWTQNGVAVEPFTYLDRAFAARHRLLALQDSGQLDEGQGSPGHAHAVLHLDQQRHRRGQFGKSADRRARQYRRPDVRRQHRLDCRVLLVRSAQTTARSPSIRRSFARRSTRSTAPNLC